MSFPYRNLMFAPWNPTQLRRLYNNTGVPGCRAGQMNTIRGYRYGDCRPETRREVVNNAPSYEPDHYYNITSLTADLARYDAWDVLHGMPSFLHALTLWAPNYLFCHSEAAGSLSTGLPNLVNKALGTHGRPCVL